MVWQKITINKNQLDAGARQHIWDRFSEAHAKAEEPEDAMLLISRFADQTGALEIYFSPRAAELAENIIEEYAGIPCNAPPRSEVDVFYGSGAALDLLDRAA
jgi:hypothetical protein